MTTRQAASRISEMPDEYPHPPAIKRPIDPVTAASRFMVRSLLADPEVMHVAASPAGLVVVQVPDAGWLEPIADQWRMLARGGVDPVRGDAGSVVGQGGWVSFQRSGAERINPAKSGDALVEHALCMGAAVAGFSPVPDQALPPALLQVADLRIAFPPMSPGIMRKLLRALTKSKWTAPLDPDLLGRLTPSILRLARRPGQDAADYVARLASLVEGGRIESRPGPRLEDLAGMDAAVAWGMRLIRGMRDYRAGSLQWADMDRGLLLHGAPGTGKTMFAESLARSSGLSLVGASFAKWQSAGDGNLGDCLKAMCKSFDEARQLAPGILFIDELDAIGDRARAEGRNRDYWVSVVACFLELLDGLGGREGVLVIGATNNPGALDPAILRSGRMDRMVEVPLPDHEALNRILRHHLRDELADSRLDDVARLAAGGSGADCAR